MKPLATVTSELTGCILCGSRVVVVGRMIPLSDEHYTALMRLRESPIDDGGTPILCYGLCREHARQPERSAAQAQARIMAAAAAVPIQ